MTHGYKAINIPADNDVEKNEGNPIPRSPRSKIYNRLISMLWNACGRGGNLLSNISKYELRRNLSNGKIGIAEQEKQNDR